MPPTTPTSNPYDFITSPTNTSAGGFRSDNKKQRILLVAVAAIVVIFLFVVVSTLLGNAGKAQTQKLTELAQTQTELARIAGIGSTKAGSLETKSLAINAQLSLISSRQDTINILKKRGVKLKDKQLAASRNSKTDALLQDAGVNNRFDQTFTETIQTKLASYQKQAKSVYSSSTPAEQKTILPSINSIGLLLPTAKAQAQE